MANAHVICPAFFEENIKNPNTSHVLLGKLLNSEDQIVIDREERLIYKYLDSVKDDMAAFEKYKAWMALLNCSPQGKKLISSSLNATQRQEIVVNTILQAVTTHDKSIVVHDTNCYRDFIQEINRQRVNMFQLHDLGRERIKKKFSRIQGFSDFEDDLLWALHRTARMSKKSWTEDEVNDLLREMIASMGRTNGYDVRDQAREGISQSGKSAGELDLLIENEGLLYTIIESMRLNSLDKEYIKTHYSKLVTNYNPLGVHRTYLVTYYNGSNFSAWWDKYYNLVSETNADELTGIASSFSEDLISLPPKYGNLKSLQHLFRHDGQIFICTHFAINIGDKSE
ncbi:hypothetical protein C4Q28_04830 [Pseudomonas sp. SWI6]|uniref:hypothetical protein n=1 Tax=Pseudomonas sp. SWI6 TaxID=2083051 RepID=UPI000CE5DAC7|nr:hypothetical protein [Pseudomonas sp. SWI6]AVD81532.1 hypothetical protein C4Q28_04830 [Pseudomonas sp. SWI6]